MSISYEDYKLRKEFFRLPHVQEILEELSCLDAFEANIPNNPGKTQSLYVAVDIDRECLEMELKWAFKDFLREKRFVPTY